MILDSTQSLEIRLAGAVATTELPFTASFCDRHVTGSAAQLVPKATNPGTTNGTSRVPVIPAPSNPDMRVEACFTLPNKDTAEATAIIELNTSGSWTIIREVTLDVGDVLSLTKQGEWQVHDSRGQQKTTNAASSGTTSSDIPSPFAGVFGGSL